MRESRLQVDLSEIALGSPLNDRKGAETPLTFQDSLSKCASPPVLSLILYEHILVYLINSKKVLSADISVA